METLSTLDIAALVWFAVVTVGYRMVLSFPALERRSIVHSMQAQRRRWMRNMAHRDNRMIDAVLLGALGQGNAFFASTSAIAIGGLAAIMGSGDKAILFLNRIPYAAQSSPMLWEIKIVLLMSIFVFAFFKFAWAFRLSHYVNVMIGATPLPDDSNTVEREHHAVQTAQLIGLAADHANGGIRAFYYALAALTWFFHPLMFAAAITWVAAILTRRDFFSRAHRIVSERHSG